MRKLFTLFLGVIFGLSVNAQTDCSDLYFSEYVEGSGFNKVLEIYNPTSSSIDLSTYVLVRFNNGSPLPSDTMMFSGSLAGGAVFVVANSSAIDSFKDNANRLDGIANWNGDDAIALVKITGPTSVDTIDVFGIVGNDPGSEWTVGNGSTKDHTLTRRSTVKSGVKTWDPSEWKTNANNLAVYIGDHASDCIKPVANSKSQINFEKTSYTLEETSGIVQIYISADSVGVNDPVTVTVSAIAGSATSGADFNFMGGDVTLENGDLRDSIEFNVLDDADIEGDETVSLIFTILAGNADAVNDTLMITITSDDYALSKIGDVNLRDANGDLMYKDSVVKVVGVVHGPNYQPSRLEFRLWDGTGAVTVFAGNNLFDYNVKDGDSIEIVGFVNDYNGLTQLQIEDFGDYTGQLSVIDSNKTTMTPMVLDSLSDDYESYLVTLHDLSFGSVDRESSSGNNYWIHMSSGDSFLMRMDGDVPAYGVTSFPEKFSATGYIGQFYDLQLQPRYVEDIKSTVSTQDVIVAKDIKVFPNPASDKITIQSDVKVKRVDVYNLVGAKVKSFTNVENTIDVSSLRDGVYLIEIETTAGKVFARRIVKK
jgi:hypothetical protein